MHTRRTLLVWFGLVLALLAWNGRIVLAAQPAPAHSAATPQSTGTSLPQRVIAIDASSNRTCAVTADGKVWCWPGQSGQSDVHLVRGVPVQEMPFDARAVMVASRSNCVVTTENRILCWVAGSTHAQGQIRELSGFTGTVRALVTGREICALNDSGTVFCWNSVVLRPSAPTIPIVSGAVSMSIGGSHTCAAMADGRVLCWGYNSQGQLGDGTTEDRENPVVVTNLPRNIIAVAAGQLHTCALGRDGRVWCWGYNSHGQLGDGTTQTRTSPVAVVDLPANMTGIAAGYFHTCAFIASGGAWCWGNNFHGSLGNNEINTYRTKPVAVTGLTGVTALTAGLEHTCALTVGGSVMCWGRDLEGQLGAGRLLWSGTAQDGVPLPGGARAITAGLQHTCAVTADGRVMCWGAEYDKNLCDVLFLSRGAPTAVASLTGITALDAGAGHTCALTATGGVFCWGENYFGNLGNATAGRRSDPVPVTNLSSGVQTIAAGGEHTCALKQNGEVVCWGARWGATPTAIAGLPRDVRAIDAGFGHTCALAADGSVRCWGKNGSGQLGDGTFASYDEKYETPVMVNGLSGARAVAAGGEHTCAITAAGGVVCWGDNRSGQLGDGTTANRATPVAVQGLSEGVVALAAGSRHTCALTVDQQVKCWGEGFNAQNTAAPAGIGVPVTIAGINGQVVALTAGGGHTCALLANGATACWGSNQTGELGLGDAPSRGMPALVELGLSRLYVPLVNR